jgi:hypothetical protein
MRTQSSTVSLTLPEQVLLVALKDESGTLESKASYWRQVLAGAVLAELIVSERIELGERKRVNLLNSEPTNNPLSDHWLSAIQARENPKTMNQWISKISGMSKLLHQLANQLCEKGVLKLEESKVLFVFNRKTYPTVNPEPEQTMVQQLSNAIFEANDDIDVRTMLLISLLHPAGMLGIYFENKALRPQKDRINQIIQGEAVGQSTAAAIQAVQTAIIVAAVMPAIIASTTATTSS